MNSNYKRLGDWITPLTQKNSDGVTKDVRGVNYQKFFMPSVANIIGVDLTSYKLVTKGQFACNLMHVGRDECLPIALHTEESPIIVSPAYFTFEIKDTTVILPEFLFLWFKRAEFDREATFYTDADVRQGLIKSAFLDMLILVPPIEEQRKIVAEYQAIERRIENNRRLISALEDTAQSIYRHFFVDNIDPKNLPTGWCLGQVGDVMTISSGKSLSEKNESETSSCSIPVAGASGIIGYTSEANQFDPFLTTGRVGTLGVVNKYLTPTWAADNVLVAKSKNYEFAYHTLKEVNYAEITDGGVQSLITQTSLSAYPKIIPPAPLIQQFESTTKSLSGFQSSIRKEILLLSNLHSILLSKLSIS